MAQIATHANLAENPGMIPSLTSIARLSVDIARPMAIGQTEAGLREVIPITGGRVEGMLSGRVLAGGADWCLTRPDGAAEVWARYTLELEGGALVGVLNTGLAFPQPDGSFRGHTVPQFEVASGPMLWLRRHMFLGTLHAAAAGDEVVLEFFRVD